MSATSASETGAPVAAPAPSSTEMATRLRQERLPRSWSRILSSMVTGLMTAVWGTLLVALTMKTGDPVARVMFVVIFGSMTAGSGWLTWRWARSLPPARFLATTRERDEIDG